MATYTVIWRADAGVITSLVETDRDPNTILEGEWVDMANHREMVEAGYTPAEMASEPKPSESGFDLYGVARNTIDWIA